MLQDTQILYAFEDDKIPVFLKIFRSKSQYAILRKRKVLLAASLSILSEEKINKEHSSIRRDIVILTI